MKILKRIIYSLPIFSDEFQKFEWLFRQTSDPWNYKRSIYEQERYKILLEYVKKIKPKKILELGCAEGIFTQKLSKICNDITAIELSKIAIKRAKERIPKVKFINSDFSKFKSQDFFDLVIAGEVLYYSKNDEIYRFLKTIKTNFLLTSNFWTKAFIVERIIKKSNFYLIDTKRITYFENFIIKSSKISLWKK